MQMRWLFIIGLISSPLLSGCYVLKQSYYQVDLLLKRESIATVMAKPNTDPQVKIELKEVQAILRYASANGLKTDDAYQSYVDVGRDHLTYVCACRAF